MRLWVLRWGRVWVAFSLRIWGGERMLWLFVGYGDGVGGDEDCEQEIR